MNKDSYIEQIQAHQRTIEQADKEIRRINEEWVKNCAPYKVGQKILAPFALYSNMGWFLKDQKVTILRIDPNNYPSVKDSWHWRISVESSGEFYSFGMEME